MAVGGTVFGLTATPIVKGLRETWEAVVNATTTDALVADGYLAPVEIYAATEIDMKGASKTAGEWTAGAIDAHRLREPPDGRRT